MRGDNLGDSQLIRKAQQGDIDALNTLFRREWKSVYALIYRIVQDRSAAEDLTQDAFLRALRALDRYEDTGIPFRAFLATVARNLARSYWRRRPQSTLNSDHLHGLISGESTPEALALVRDEQDDLDAVLRTLPADYETVIRLRILDDRSTTEVAAIMNRSPGAIRVLQHRALAALRTRMPEGTRYG